MLLKDLVCIQEEYWVGHLMDDLTWVDKETALKIIEKINIEKELEKKKD